MLIHANTKIASILKYRPEALDTIIEISPRFRKLRNPVLRQLMAGRTSIAMAAKLGGCTVADFFTRLKPLGFEIDNNSAASALQGEREAPAFMKNLDEAVITGLDVRPVIAAGKDPLRLILKEINSLPTGQVLKIINGFEPTPLMALLEKQGFESFTNVIGKDWVETYFHKSTKEPVIKAPDAADTRTDWDTVLEKYANALQHLDVRSLEMPLPIITILHTLDGLETDSALLVDHKKIPVFLLPELEERKFDYRIKEVDGGEVRLLIFKD